MSVPLSSLRNRLLHTNNMRGVFSRLPASPRLLSATRNIQATEKGQDPHKQPQAHQPQKPGNPEYPAFSLDSLGLSKNMKIVVLVLISIFGTIETWFYCQAIWRWWKNRQESQEAWGELQQHQMQRPFPLQPTQFSIRAAMPHTRSDQRRMGLWHDASAMASWTRGELTSHVQPIVIIPT